MMPFQVVIGRGCTAETIRECIPALFDALKEQGVDLAALMRQQTPPSPVQPLMAPVVAPQVAAPMIAPVQPRPTVALPSGAAKGPWELAYNAPDGFAASLRLTADQDAALAGCSPAMISRIRESIAEFCIKNGGKNGQLRPTVAVVGDEYEITSGTAERLPAAGALPPVTAEGDADAGAADW